MTPQIKELLLKMTDFRQEITHMERLLVANEVSRLYGELAEAQGYVDYAALCLAKPENGQLLS